MKTYIILFREHFSMLGQYYFTNAVDKDSAMGKYKGEMHQEDIRVDYSSLKMFEATEIKQ